MPSGNRLLSRFKDLKILRRNLLGPFAVRPVERHPDLACDVICLRRLNGDRPIGMPGRHNQR